MKTSDCTGSSENEEEEEIRLEGKLIAIMEENASQEADCENNCLSGIKWQPKHHKKSDRKKREVLNGYRKLKSEIVTHGGRTSKLPARFMETDSENELGSNRKRVRDARRDSNATSGERTATTCTVTKRRPSRNGRTDSLETNEGKLSKQQTKDNILCSALVDGFDAIVDIQREEFGSEVHNPPSAINASCDLSRTLTQGLKRKFLNSQSETETSSEDTPPRKRGRPCKSASKLVKTARGKASRNCEVVSPHGDCLTSATNASLTSPSTLKPKRKKRKLLNGLRNSRSALRNLSGEESSCSEPPTPKRRGRPPKHLSSPKIETKHREFDSQNGVSKPWVRPVLKALHKRALFRSPVKHLESLLTPREKLMSKVKAKLVKVNGYTLPRGCADSLIVKRRRGRPPKQSPHKVTKTSCRKKEDAFLFTDEEDSGECRKTVIKAKLKKLKKIQKLKLPKQYGKKPIGAGKLKSVKHNKKVLANKLKNKAIKKAKGTLRKRKKSIVMAEDSKVAMDTSRSRRRRNKIDRVLGMRLNSCSQYEYLVQWFDGTSSWTSPDQAADFALDLREFLSHEYQDLPVINRLVYKAYYYGNLDIKLPEPQCSSTVDSEDLSSINTDLDDGDITDNEDLMEENIDQPVRKRGRKRRDSLECKEFVCKEVSVQHLEDCIHIVVRRSSGKQLRVNLRIIDSLTLAMEDAAVDSVNIVVISGLGDDLFCGIDLNTIVTIPLDCEMKRYRKDVDKIRYLIQTIQHFPKPVIATISKPAQGLGAQLVALCDMVCDEASLGSPIDLALAKANGVVPYCFPRLMGHSAISEQVLMGQPVSTPIVDWRDSLSEVFNGASFTSKLSTSVKAMSKLPSIAQTGMCTSDRDRQYSAADEKWLAQEVKKEQQKFEDSLKDLASFWEDVTAQVS